VNNLKPIVFKRLIYAGVRFNNNSLLCLALKLCSFLEFFLFNSNSFYFEQSYLYYFIDLNDFSNYCWKHLEIQGLKTSHHAFNMNNTQDGKTRLIKKQLTASNVFWVSTHHHPLNHCLRFLKSYGRS
jgi:hypothetical protein